MSRIALRFYRSPYRLIATSALPFAPIGAVTEAELPDIIKQLVCENQDGTVLRRVESKRLGQLLEKYRLGEIWRIGELGGNP